MDFTADPAMGILAIEKRDFFMPIILINSLPPSDTNVIPEMLKNVRNSGAEALQCSQDNVWVMFQPVEPRSYIYGIESAFHPNDNTHPPIVTIKAQGGRSPKIREAFVKAVAGSVGKGLSISPENVWIHYQEMKPQDIWFKGGWGR